MFSFKLIRSKPGRDPGMAGRAALQGLVSALNSKLPVFSVTGSWPNTQNYNQNVAYDLTDDGLVPQGQGAPFTPTPPRKPWTR